LDDRADRGTGRTTPLERAGGAALAFLVLGFVGLMFAAARQYPGGTWCHPDAPGYQLLDSFFCDVLHRRGLNGAPNPGAPLARAALVLLGLGFLPFWLTLPRTMKLPPLRATLVRAFGTVSALASFVVALAPSDRLPLLHQFSVLSATGLGIGAALLAATTRAKSRASRWLRGVAWCALLTSGVDATLYVAQVVDPAPCAVWLPALQKVAAAFTLAWMLGSALTLLRPATGPMRRRA
jgi:hypothetical protein